MALPVLPVLDYQLITAVLGVNDIAPLNRAFIHHLSVSKLAA
jgi:hypothetical protein